MELFFNRKLRKLSKKIMLMVFALSFLCGGALLAQKPDLPQLSFGLRDAAGKPYQNNGDINRDDWWPDSRIWTVPSRPINNGATPDTIWNEVLVPVFISNGWGWEPHTNVAQGVVFDEIESFSFRVYYDDRVLEFVDVQKHHPFTREEATNLRTTHFYYELGGEDGAYYEPLSKHFNLSTGDAKATDYWKYFDISDNAHAGIGRTVTVTGTANSFYSLPTTFSKTAPYSPLKRVLVYLKFKVLRTPTTTVQPYSKLYFDPSYIVYNNTNIAKDKGLKLLKDFPTNIATLGTYFNNIAQVVNTNDNLVALDTTTATGLSLTQINQKINSMVGLQIYSNYDVSPEARGKYIDDPYLPGTIDVKIMNTLPEFRFNVINSNNVSATPIYQLPNDHSTWILTEPITQDILAGQRSAYRNQSERAIDISITGSPATMENIIVETDQPWLKVRTPKNSEFDDKLDNTNSVRRGFVQRINNLIDNRNDYNPFYYVVQQGQTPAMPKGFRLYIECNREIGSANALQPGEYIGYVTLKSAYDMFEPTRIQVRFIVIDSPVEVANPTPRTSEIPYGMILTISPNTGYNPAHTDTLIIGSGPLATDIADTLYGEFPRTQPLGYDTKGDIKTFDARLFLDPTVYPRDTNTSSVAYQQWQNLVNNGFGDLTHYDGFYQASYNDNYRPRSNSRDIRTSNASNQSHVFLVKFKYNGSDGVGYPVKLRWDTKQFIPEVNTIFLKYRENDVDHLVDMRTEGSPAGNGVYTFEFRDETIQEFRIEYTIGTQQKDNLVDNFGDPIIMPNAWNLVSLPLNPVSPLKKNVYPNANSAAYQFVQSANAWVAFEDNQALYPGLAYFVRYGADVDKVFHGAFFKRINSATFPVRVYRSVFEDEGAWNAIGALSVPATLDDINFEAFNNTQPNIDYTRDYGVWAYRPKGGYEEVNSILPGKGYWIKVDKDGYYGIQVPKAVFQENAPALTNKVAGFDKITIADNSQNVASVYAANNVDARRYELPPVPPTEMFDVRFGNGSYATDYSDATILLQGVTYPVNMNFNNTKANFTVIDPANGYVYGKVQAGTNNNIVINSSKTNAFKLVAEIVNDGNFVTVNENPVTTNIADVNFGINQESYVTLSIINSIGSVVANVELGNLSKGIYSQNIDVTNLYSGSYIVRMTAGSEIKSFRMNIVK